MFKKAQLKLFAIITAILLAIFVTVLGSINIIMNMVMERQSRTVLKQIAAGVEYDDATSTFNYLRPEKIEKPEHEKTSEVTTTAKSEVTTASTAAVTTSQTTVETTSEAAVTTAAEVHDEPVTEQHETETTPPVQQETAPEPKQDEQPPAVVQPPAENTPPTEPNPPAQPNPPEPPKPDEHQEQNTDNNNNQWDWGQWGGDPNNYNWGGYPPYNPWWGWEGGWYDPNQFKVPYIGSPEPETDKDNGGHHKENDEQFRDGDDRKPVDEHEKSAPDGMNASSEEGSIISLANRSDSARSSKPDSKTSFLPLRDGSEPVPKSLGSIDFFIVMADNDGNYLATLNNDELSSENAQKYITKIIDSGSETGTLNELQFYLQKKNNGTLLVFTDKSAEIDMLNKLIRTTVVIGLLSFLLLSAAAFLISRQIIKPLKIAFEKQKQFVSDASHELKTPVTVISANADVLSDEIGENKWLTYIKSQTERMNILVNDLLNLTRLENNTSSDFIRTDFDLSKAIVNTALPFECQAFETNKNFVVDVEEGLTINGSEKHIKQMAAIFIDNALKYSNDGGTVSVTLEKFGDKKVLSVFNTGSGIKEEDKNKIFERFYRSDESRNRATGGYGLGLAIAKSVIDRHKFKVNIENDEGRSIRFVVTM